MKTYLDLGCHNGESVRDFFSGKFGEIDYRGMSCVAFDPISNYEKEWQELEKQYPVKFISKAVYVHNGDIDFSQREGKEDTGSSVMRDKAKYENGKVRKVPCIDFVEYLQQFDKGSVVVRMDIEGAEYPILRKLLDTGIIDRIHYIEIEFHAVKMDSKYKKDEDRIIKELRMSGIGFKEITK